MVAGLLYGISAHDILAFAEASLLLGIVAVLAMYMPARRATQVESHGGLALRVGDADQFAAQGALGIVYSVPIGPVQPETVRSEFRVPATIRIGKNEGRVAWLLCRRSQGRSSRSCENLMLEA